MATFDFGGLLPQTKALISSAQLRNRFNDIKDHINTNNVSGVVFGSTASAAQWQGFLLDATKLAGTWSHLLRADGAIQLTGVSSLADGDMLYFNGTNLVEVSVGSSGDTLKLSGTTPTWTTVAATDAWTNKTVGFTAANNGRYTCNAGIAIALPAPSDNLEFWFRPKIGQDLTSSAITITQNASENIAGAAETFTADVNGVYHIFSDGTDWDVSVYAIAR